jgi:hypothetical protein
MELLISIFNKVKKFYVTVDGGKKIISIKRTLVSLVIIFFVIFLPLSLMNFFSEKEDTSQINRSTTKMKMKKENVNEQQTTTQDTNMGGVRNHQKVNTSQGQARRIRNSIKINYKAAQVLSANHKNGGKVLPIGVNLVGKLLTSIDTRALDQYVKVILPYGGEHKGSGGSLPQNTILFGKASYSGNGNKVLVSFDKGLLPNGQQIQLQAQAVSSKDYSIGLLGERHGNTLGRTAATLGLTMVSTMSGTLVRKEALGQGFQITPKASLQDGFYNGLSQVANAEANRTAKKMANNKEYVTIDAGRDLIISLVGSYEGQNER